MKSYRSEKTKGWDTGLSDMTETRWWRLLPADAEACADALADVFYQALMEQLISLKPDIAKEQMAAVASEKEQTDT